VGQLVKLRPIGNRPTPVANRRQDNILPCIVLPDAKKTVGQDSSPAAGVHAGLIGKIAKARMPDLEVRG
jgi:hypothetical protein